MYSEDFTFSMSEVIPKNKPMKGGSNIIKLDLTVSESENPFVSTEEYNKVMKGGVNKFLDNDSFDLSNNSENDSDSFGVSFHGGANDSSSDSFDSSSSVDFSSSSSSTDNIIDELDFENSEESDFTSYEKYKKQQKKHKSPFQKPHQSSDRMPSHKKEESDRLPSSDKVNKPQENSDSLSSATQSEMNRNKYVFSKSSDVVLSNNNNYETSSLNTSDIQVLNVKKHYNKQSRSKKGSKKTSKKASKKSSKKSSKK